LASPFFSIGNTCVPFFEIHFFSITITSTYFLMSTSCHLLTIPGWRFTKAREQKLYPLQSAA